MEMAARTLPPKLELAAPQLLADPYPTYRRLREAAPLCRLAPGTWGVTRHADVAALLRDPRLGSEFPAGYHERSAGSGAAARFFARIVLYRDPPAHTRLRRLLGHAFSPGAVRALRPTIERLATGLLEPILAAGGCDAVTDVAFPLPILVVCELMGIPAGARAEVQPRAADLGRAFAAIVGEDDRRAADAAVVWLRDFLTGILAERRRRPGEDLLSRLLAAEDGGARLSEEEIVDNAVFAFFAGFETTTNLLATAVSELARAPGDQASLRADPALLPSAVEEFLRWDPPIQGVARLVREPVPLHGRTLRPGRVAVLLIGSANRDPAAFADPERLVLERDPNPHLSFGGGAHLCMGAALAREEARVLLGLLLRNTRGWSPAGAVTRRDHGIRGYASIPLTVEPGTEGSR